MPVTQQEYDDLRAKSEKQQRVINRKAAEATDAIKRAEAAEKAAADAKATLERTLAENSLKKENDNLKAQITEAKHRVEFARVAKAKGATDDVIDSVWKLSGYEAKGEPDAEAIGTLIDEAKAKPGIAPLFAPPSTVDTKLPSVKPGVGSGQGGKGGAPSSHEMADDDARLSDVAYQMANFDAIAKAAAEKVAQGR